MLYRYEFKHNQVGIFIGMDDIFDPETAFGLSAFFDDELKRPCENLENTISYFTEKGNRKFSKALRKIKKASVEKGYEVIKVEKEENELEILYKDKYQVLAKR